MPLSGPATSNRRSVIELLAEARVRTLLIVSPLSDEEMRLHPDPAVNPVLTELSRIASFEQRWLLDDHEYVEVESYDQWFDSMLDIRQRVLDRVDLADGSAGTIPAGDRYHMVQEYEYHRNEAIFETLQCLGEPYRAPHQRLLPKGRTLADPGFMSRFAGGTVEIGGRTDSVVWPEEQPFHQVDLAPFWIDVMPVTNADFMTFMASGAYENRAIWSDDGWRWLEASRARAPANWTRVVDGVWHGRWMGRESALRSGSPVSQVSYFEAEAFATFVGKRLPSELEWETAAGWDPETQCRRDYPWGNMPPTIHVANLDQFALEPASVGAFPGNVSPLGCYGMIGDVWEWTASAFLPYAPDSATSEPPTHVILSEAKSLPRALRGDLSAAPEFDQQKRVLRGGSWATRPGAIRVSVRRPAAPGARHLFTGFRCARSA
jgi:iron(II)-dependent oxidoreductase